MNHDLYAPQKHIDQIMSGKKISDTRLDLGRKFGPGDKITFIGANLLASKVLTGSKASVRIDSVSGSRAPCAVTEIRFHLESDFKDETNAKH